MKKMLLFALVSLFILSTSPVYAQAAKLDRRIEECTDLFEEVMQMPDKAIPEDLLSKCSGVAIFPSVLKGGFFIGGRYGKGVVLYRDKRTGKWSTPAFYTIGGLSYGLQIGGQAIDLILVITSKRGMKSLIKNSVTLGGDLAASAGPIGRNVEAGTDLLLKAGILSYSRSRGLFAGIALKGAVIKPDIETNKSYYSEDVTAEDILFNKKVKPTPTGRQLINILGKYSK